MTMLHRSRVQSLQSILAHRLDEMRESNKQDEFRRKRDLWGVLRSKENVQWARKAIAAHRLYLAMTEGEK